MKTDVKEMVMEMPASIMEKIGDQVTTECKLGGIGLGRILPEECYKPGQRPTDIAWQSGGNGFYYPKNFRRIYNDGGRKYIETIKGIGR